MLRLGRGDRQHVAAQFRLASQRGTAAFKTPPLIRPWPVMTRTQRLPAGASAGDKAGERAVRLGLGHAVQIEPPRRPDSGRA